MSRTVGKSKGFDNPHPEACPKPTKKCWKTNGQALPAALSMARYCTLVRIYECECGLYHLTTKERRDKVWK